MTKTAKISLIITLILVSSILINAKIINLKDKNVYDKTFNFPDTIDFAGENTPLQIMDVYERFDRELIVNENLHSATNLIIKRANRVFPIIEPILKKNGIPDDFKYLAVIESNLTNTVSPSGARGVWQFMPATAKEYGMEVNETVDERYHLEKATEAACKYFIDAKAKLGSWTLAAAAYNCGVSGLLKQMDAQKESDYYDLLLNEETSRYVFRILALKEIMNNQILYGFNLKNNELYEFVPTKKLEIDTSITDLASFAKLQGINYKILKLHNPWLRDKKLENTTKKTYYIEIPLTGY